MRYLVTGVNGLVGKSVYDHIISMGYLCVGTVRAAIPSEPKFKVFDLGKPESLSNIVSDLSNTDVVIHCAAKLSVTGSNKKTKIEEYRNINVNGTLLLARKAASLGVKRFVFLSTAKVHGARTYNRIALEESSDYNPPGAYETSKAEAEEQLLSDPSLRGIEIVIVRPPLVYGPRAKGNFATLTAAISRSVPLPLKHINNQRSLVAIKNLTDFLFLCSNHPKAVGQTFFVSDLIDVSTSELVQAIAKSMNTRAVLLPIPRWIMFALMFGVGKSKTYEQVFGDFQLNCSKAKRLIGWSPVISMNRQVELLSMSIDTDKAQKNKKNIRMFRVLDLLISGIGLLVFTPLFLLLVVLIFLENRSPIFAQKRIGLNKKTFVIFKFRTMSLGTESIATHLVDQKAITKLGKFLRRSKLDELPQLWNVFRGDMSLVGPRPGLFNQNELTKEREKLGVFGVPPGITGLAQINGIDMSTPEILAKTDALMISQMSAGMYFKYIFATVFGRTIVI